MFHHPTAEEEDRPQKLLRFRFDGYTGRPRSWMREARSTSSVASSHTRRIIKATYLGHSPVGYTEGRTCKAVPHGNLVPVGRIKERLRSLGLYATTSRLLGPHSPVTAAQARHR